MSEPDLQFHCGMRLIGVHLFLKYNGRKSRRRNVITKIILKNNQQVDFKTSRLQDFKVVGLLALSVN